MSGCGQFRSRASRGGCLVKLPVLLVAVLAAAALGWMLYLPLWVTGQIRARTGCDATVASLSCNPFGGRLAVRGLVVSNPGTWPTRDFVELREFVAEVDVWTLLAERIVVDSLTLDMRRVTLVRRADGKSNAELFQPAGPVRNAAPDAAGRKAGEGPGAAVERERKFLIRRLALRFDQLVIADYSGATPVVNEHKLALDQRYENVTAAKQLLVPEVLRRVAAENLGPALGRLVPGEVGRALGGTARDAAAGGAELLKDAGQRANDLLRGLREKLEETKKP